MDIVKNNINNNYVHDDMNCIKKAKVMLGDNFVKKIEFVKDLKKELKLHHRDEGSVVYGYHKDGTIKLVSRNDFKQFMRGDERAYKNWLKNNPGNYNKDCFHLEHTIMGTLLHEVGHWIEELNSDSLALYLEDNPFLISGKCSISACENAAELYAAYLLNYDIEFPEKVLSIIEDNLKNYIMKAKWECFESRFN